jgi:hypothetical protein
MGSAGCAIGRDEGVPVTGARLVVAKGPAQVAARQTWSAIDFACAGAGGRAEDSRSRTLFEHEFLKAPRSRLRNFGVEDEVSVDHFGTQYAPPSL